MYVNNFFINISVCKQMFYNWFYVKLHYVYLVMIASYYVQNIDLSYVFDFSLTLTILIFLLSWSLEFLKLNLL